MACHPYWNNVVLACHFNGANGSTTFVDEKGHSLTAVGNAQISTAQSVFNGSSLLCDGDGDYVQVGSYTNLDFLNGALCIDAFFYMASASEFPIFSRLSSTYGITYEHSFSVTQDYFHVYWGVRGSSQAHLKFNFASSLSLNAFHHVRVRRDSDGLWSAEANGTPASTWQYSPLSSGISYGGADSFPCMNKVNFGSHSILPSICGNWNQSANGHLAELIIAKGEVNIVDLSPPSAAFVTNQCVISGNVNVAGGPGQRFVRAHDRATGVVVGSGLSNATTGDYSIDVSTDVNVYVVEIDSDTSPPSGTPTENAQIFDYVTPV